ncbi:CaiB/BaiF CoA transferase family protein [Alicyclobacillus mengziensis]|uniref:CoA transferase n=1 Tax=Alicyclobacillus mengziensis TaxID=2931921 RepID=A0A9X7VXW0_9BACL|nr:CaiB/BaiF CoA-transferase family protein [Alicyclobacillus mengziensis]QSO47038.1 CoA transferase [Alicyclobacillus mengziensis]
MTDERKHETTDERITDETTPCTPSKSSQGNKPLAGIKILDLSRVLSGPFCTMLLADMGADVIKVEPPSGDETRTWGPPFQNGESAYFMSINRNKRAICLNLTSEAGQKIAHELANHADVVIENFRPGKAAKLAVDYDTLSQLQPNLIYCSISGFGQDSPLVDRPGYDFIAQAMAGLMSLTGEPEGEPMKAGVPTADLVTGLYAAISILAALHKRDATGEGSYIDISLFDSQLSLAAQVAANYLVSGHAPRRYGNAHPNIVPYQSFRTKDGSIAVAVGNNQQFDRFCQALGHPDLSSDSRFATNGLRNTNREELTHLLTEVFATESTELWVQRLNQAEIPNGPIQSLPQVLGMEHVTARNLIWQTNHPVTGDLRMLGNPMKFRGTTLGVALPPPCLGEHTDPILREIGLSNDDIQKLRQSGVVS